jgi:hypothetical protein
VRVSTGDPQPPDRGPPTGLGKLHNTPRLWSDAMPTDAVRTVVGIAAGNHSVVTRKSAVSSGLSPHNIATAKRRGWLDEPSPGVLAIAGSPDSWRRRAAIVLAAADEQARLSHRAASTLFGLDGFADPDAGCRIEEELPGNVRSLGPVTPGPTIDVLVLQPYGFRLPPGIDAKMHQTDRVDVVSDQVVIDGLTTTSLARTLCDLGAVCPDEVVWRALISARRKHDLNPRWLAQTARDLERPGPTGAGTMRRLLRRWGTEGTLPESWLEELMGRLLRDPAIPGFVRQYIVTDADNQFVARVDAAVPAARLALEGHSREFHFGPINETADEDRDLRLTAAGYETVYLGWYATKSPAAVAATIRQIIVDRLELFAATA